MARARNQPKRLAALIVVAVLSLLVVLVAKANAAPADRDDDDVGIDEDGAGEHRLGEPWSEIGPCDCDEGTFARLVAQAPDVGEVVAAAQRAAGIAGDPSGGWRRRSKLAALVPALSIRVGNTQSWREVVEPTVNRAAAFDVRASWRLDQLVFDPLELRIAAQEIARRRERRAVAAVASRAYFAWLRAEAGSAADGGVRRGRWTLGAAEAAAQLDALTDGWFSERVDKPRESR